MVYEVKKEICHKKINLFLIKLKNIYIFTRKCYSALMKNTHSRAPQSIETYIFRAKEAHNNRYTYTGNYKVDKHGKKQLEVICATHGNFFTDANSHINKRTNCVLCSRRISSEKRFKPEAEFFEECRKVHNNKYTYIPGSFKGTERRFEYICPMHEKVSQVASYHQSGNGCPKCGRLKVLEGVARKRLSMSQIVSKSTSIFGENTYEYLSETVKDNKDYLKLRCTKHDHLFKVSVNEHLDKHAGCPKCSVRNSKSENELVTLLSPHTEVIWRDKKILNGLELDLYLPKHNIGIEFNGNFWHSTAGVKLRHKDKTINEIDKLTKSKSTIKSSLAAEKGIRVIHIFEDEIHDRKTALVNSLLGLVGAVESIGARETKIVLLSNNDSYDFLNNYHLQGPKNATEVYGLIHKENLVSVMSFTYHYKKEEWELTRAASSIRVSGGASKLFQHFIKKHRPAKVFTFSEDRFFSGEVYPKLGFTKTHITKPEYYIIYKNKRYHRMWARKSVLASRFGDEFDPKLTELENCFNLGIHRVYGIGISRYDWFKQPGIF